MSEAELEKHIEAAQRELRVHAWSGSRVEQAFSDLGLRRERALVSRRRAATIGGTAFALAAMVALAFVALRTLTPNVESPATTAAVGEAGVERIGLGEGTDVRFERGADVGVRERTDSRVVVSVQSGTARFRVRHDPRRLFRVEAGGVVVEDLGTTFVVENNGSSVRVAVSEGSVSVSFPTPGGEAHQTVTLNAGESGTYPAREIGPSPDAEKGASSLEEPSAQAEASGQPRSPGAAALADWRELARAGKHRLAYELLAPNGFRDVRDDPSDLLLASDVARLSRHPAEAAMLLRKLLSRHERDPRAPSAAFTLGWVLMNELGRPREAALAFGRAEALAPGGNLAEDAVARSVEAWYRSGELSRAKAEVERYRKSYPQGRHHAMLQRLIGTP